MLLGSVFDRFRIRGHRIEFVRLQPMHHQRVQKETRPQIFVLVLAISCSALPGPCRRCFSKECTRVNVLAVARHVEHLQSNHRSAAQHPKHLRLAHHNDSADPRVILGHALFCLQNAGQHLNFRGHRIQSRPSAGSTAPQALPASPFCTTAGAFGTGSLRVVKKIKQPESSSEGASAVIAARRKTVLSQFLPAPTAHRSPAFFIALPVLGHLLVVLVQGA